MESWPVYMDCVYKADMTFLEPLHFFKKIAVNKRFGAGFL